jgi:hypothetical protein
MAQIKLLSNQTRAALRPPYLVLLPSGALLAKLLPVVQKPAQKPKSFDSRQPNPKKADRPQPAQFKPQNNPRSPSNNPNPQEKPPSSPPEGGSEKKPVLQPGLQPPLAPSLRLPGTAAHNPGETPPVPPRPAANGQHTSSHAASPPGSNGVGKKNFNHHSQLFRPENYPPARTNRPAERDRFKPNPASPISPPADPPRVDPPRANPPRSQHTGPSPVTQNNQPVGAMPSQPARQTRLPVDIVENLRRLFKEHDDLPTQSAVLGVGTDNFPVLLDLSDPTPGAVVVIGDEREEQMKLLQTLVASVAMRNSPRSVQVLIVTIDPKPWKEWIAAQGYDRFCLSIIGADDEDSLRDWILRLGDWTEQRRLGQRSGPPVLMVMDTLSFMPRLAYDVRLNFEWMAKEGPPAQIWPVAAISTELAQLLNSRRMLRAFQTRILGHAADPSFYVQLAGLSEQEAAGFIPPGRFAVRLGESWLTFGLPGRA